MFYPSLAFRKIGPSDLLCFAHQSFLENPVRPIYYDLPNILGLGGGESYWVRIKAGPFLVPPPTTHPHAPEGFTTSYLPVCGVGETRRWLV